MPGHSHMPALEKVSHRRWFAIELFNAFPLHTLSGDPPLPRFKPARLSYQTTPYSVYTLQTTSYSTLS
jgi:hypothetical protein